MDRAKTKRQNTTFLCKNEFANEGVNHKYRREGEDIEKHDELLKGEDETLRVSISHFNIHSLIEAPEEPRQHREEKLNVKADINKLVAIYNYSENDNIQNSCMFF